MNKKSREITPTIQKINKAINLIHEAKEIIDEVLGRSKIKDYRFARAYYSYGRYGIDQLLSNGNSYGGSLETLINELKKEGLLTNEKHDWTQYKSDFNRFEEQCQNCCCYYENWDKELGKEDDETDHECSLEFDTYINEPCGDFDNCK